MFFQTRLSEEDIHFAPVAKGDCHCQVEFGDGNFHVEPAGCGNYHYEHHNDLNQRTARNNETDHYYDYVHDYDDETDDPQDYLDDEYYLYNDSD